MYGFVLWVLIALFFALVASWVGFNQYLKEYKLPRLSGLFVLNCILLGGIFYIAPHQIPVTVYKLLLVTLAAFAGYWLDRLIFPYARPHRYLTTWNSCESESRHLSIAYACIRRAIIVGCAMLAVGLGA